MFHEVSPVCSHVPSWCWRKSSECRRPSHLSWIQSPTFLLKEFLGDLLPFLHLLCNFSLTSGFLPGSQKRAIVTPALKKHGLDSEVLNNYRPISNLSYLSKILEKLVSMQFISYLNEHDLLPAHQSGFRAGHSTETVLVRLLSVIFSAMDSGDVTLLALLDVTTAFDSVDHDIFLERLRRSFGVRGTALSWLESFIRGRTQSVAIGGRRSGWRAIRFGVPQGSVLGPASIRSIYRRNTADYSIVRLECPSICRRCSGLRTLSSGGSSWCNGSPPNRSEWSPSADAIESVKAQSRQDSIYLVRKPISAPENPDHQLLSARFLEVMFQDSVIDLGVTLDRELTMSTHVGKTCRSGFYHLRQLRLIRRYLTDETAATLVHAFVLTRIDYCNAVLVGTTKPQLNRLQMFLNTAARLLLRIPKFGHISSAIINTLHWLPVPDCLTFKICCLVWNSVVGAGPSYLQELCTWSSVGSGRILPGASFEGGWGARRPPKEK